MSPEALRVLDEIIIRQAVTLGWRITLSQLVQRRRSEWEIKAGGLEPWKVIRFPAIAEENEVHVIETPYPGDFERQCGGFVDFFAHHSTGNASHPYAGSSDVVRRNPSEQAVLSLVSENLFLW